MQDTPSDSYTYVVTIYGENAVARARQIRTQVVSEFARAEKDLAAATTQTLEAISSQTRRLSYNLTRLQDVREAADQLSGSWLRTLRIISQASDGTFDALVQDAHEAYDELAGHSVFSEILYKYLKMIANIESASEGAFEPLVQDAQEALTQIEGVLDKAGKLRFPAGAAVEGVSIQGREATPEKIEKYNQGLLKLNDVMTGIPLASAEVQQTLRDQGYVVDNTQGFWESFTDELNKATIQYFGIRRLGYGFEQFGSQLARGGQRNIDMMMGWAQSYANFNREATLAAAAMEMTREEQQMLEDTVLDNVEAMRLFDPSETVDGLRIWAAGTGQVVHTQEQLNTMLEQTRDVQLLAALGNEQLGESMEYVGAAVAEYGLSLDDTDRIAKVFNFTAAKTFAQIGDMGNAFKLVGPEAAAFGISLEETSAVLGLLSDRNIKGTMAGRAFRQMLIQLAKPTDKHNELMNQAVGANEALGESWRDLVFPEGKFIGIARYIDLLAAITENMTQEQRNSLLATIATANELPALTALVQAQTDARKEGINVIRAWTKWMIGAADEEVDAFARLMRDTRDVEVDTATDMYSLWAEQAQLFYDSQAAQAAELERRWEAMQIKLGKIVLVEGAPVLEALIEQLEKIVEFAAENPGLVTGAMTAAAVQLVLGNLISLSGQLIGVIANFLILRGAFAGFGGAVGVFQAAVTQFAATAGASAAGGAADTAGTAATLGIMAVIRRLLGVAGIILTVDQPTEEQRVFEDILEVLREEVRLSEKQWDALMELGLEPVPGVGPSYGRVVAYQFEGQPLDVQGILELLEGMDQLTEEQQQFLDELRSHPVLDVDVESEIPPELEGLLAEIEDGSTWDIEVNMFTPEDIQLLGMFDAMTEEIDDLRAKYSQQAQQKQQDLFRQLKADYDEYLRDVESMLAKHQAAEEAAYRKHQDKLNDLRESTAQQMADELERLGQRIDDVWTRANERIAETEAKTNRDIEKAREEHLKTLRRMEEDHRDRLVDLAISRDAYGIWQEMREYRKRVERENEDYQDRLKELQANGKERVDEIRRQAAREEAELKRSYERRIAELQKQLERRLAAEKENYENAERERKKRHKQELKDLEDKYKQERSDRIAAFNQFLRDLWDRFREEASAIRQAKTDEMLMLRGFYRDELYDLETYMRDRLSLIEAYLQYEAGLWASQTVPTIPPSGGGGGSSSGGTEPPPVPYDQPPPAIPTSFLVVEGGIDVTVTGDGEVPPESADALVAGVEQLFERALRSMEVRRV